LKPFEVSFEGNAKVKGAILADQVKSLDWQKRKAEKKENVSKAVIEEVVEKIKAILED
jgi:mRNA interferase MazF